MIYTKQAANFMDVTVKEPSTFTQACLILYRE